MDSRPFAAERLVIRRAGSQDAPTLAAFRAASHVERHETDAESVARFRARCSSFFARELASDAGFLHAWIACDDARPVGAAALTVVPTLPRLEANNANGRLADGRIRDVYVVPQDRRRGVGRQLILAVIAEAKRLGVDRLTLGASSMGRPLYASLGFFDKPDEMIYAL